MVDGRWKIIRCGCGARLKGEDATFWGECEVCRKRLPIQSAEMPHRDRLQSDSKYHGENSKQDV